MSKHVATYILVVTFFTVVITPLGHQQWILPNFFYTNDESPWLGIEHTSGDRRFVSGQGPGTLLSIIHPQGWHIVPSSTYVVQTRTVAEMELTERGTYRIETDRPSRYVAEIEANGKKRWVSKSKGQLSYKKIIQSTH